MPLRPLTATTRSFSRSGRRKEAYRLAAGFGDRANIGGDSDDSGKRQNTRHCVDQIESFRLSLAGIPQSFAKDYSPTQRRRHVARALVSLQSRVFELLWIAFFRSRLRRAATLRVFVRRQRVVRKNVSSA